LLRIFFFRKLKEAFYQGMEVLGKALHLTNMLDPIKFAVATESVADFTVITQ
jgi:hypothetical protein